MSSLLIHDRRPCPGKRPQQSESTNPRRTRGPLWAELEGETALGVHPRPLGADVVLVLLLSL